MQELAGNKPVYRFLLTDTWPAGSPAGTLPDFDNRRSIVTPDGLVKD
ncbi:hypothetical protein [Marinobacter piscensis]|nr:hypothetical protein [Marinobacter piscensis]